MLPMTDTTQIISPRAGTKSQRLLDLLQTGTGASLEEMIEATGWQAHTVRAAMTGLRKRGHTIARHIEGSVTVWSVEAVSE
jgi:DNA-binding IclR family transcriptional regulator